MHVVSVCPLRVVTRVWPTTFGGWTLTLVCKATYRLLPGESPLHQVQEPPYENDSTWDDDPRHSLCIASDLVPFKAHADVVLVGSAYAPRQLAARSIVARLVVGDIDKSVEAFCDRTWTLDGELREGPTITKVPLRYERAAGGPNTWNPSGVDPDRPPDEMGMVRLPNLQPPGIHIRRRDDVIDPIGFGPIAPTWPWRRDRLGRFARLWPHERWWDHPLPDGFDPVFFNVAPRDQQLAELRDGERILLENLHPDHPRLITNLATARPRAVAQRGSWADEEVALRCDTLWIDADRGICSLVWRGQIALVHADEPGRVVVTLEGAEGATTPLARKPVLDRPAPTTAGKQVLPMKTTTEELVEPTPHRGVTETISAPATVGEIYPILPFVGAAPGAVRHEAPTRAPANVTGLPFSPPADPLATSLLDPSAIAAVAQPDSLRSVAPPSAAHTPIVRPPPFAPPPALLEPSAAPPSTSPWAPSSSVARPMPTVGQSAAANRPSEGQAPLAARINPDATAPPQRSSQEIIELLWCDSEGMFRARRNPSWKKILSDARPKSTGREIDEEVPPEKRRDHRDRRDATAILVKGAPIDVADRFKDALDSGISEEGVFCPPVVLTTGEIEFPFDEIETLKATVALAMPLAGTDRKLKEAIDGATDLLKAPYVENARPLLGGAITRIRDVVNQGSANLPAHYLQSHTDRVLLEQRHYQKRRLLKRTWIRSLFTCAGGGPPMPAYIPEDLAGELPLAQRLKVRFLADLHVQLDAQEPSLMALGAFAIARILPPVRGR